MQQSLDIDGHRYIDMANSRFSILDSLRKEQTEYQDMIDIIQG